MPRELLDRFAVKEWDLNASLVTDGFRALMAELIARTRELFARARPLCDRVGPELRFEMRLCWLGGSGIFDRIEAAGDDVFHHRPHYGLLGKLGLFWRARRWKA